MNRSPLFYPLNRGMDAEAGGAADLQTDVMRFMAILSLCLVAIFALVQSIPLVPPPAIPPAIAATAAGTPATPAPPAAAEPQAAAAAPVQVALTRPAPQKLPAREKPPALQRPVPARAAAPPVPAARTAPGPAKQGFTLRFEDDAALTRLVARNEVGLYAISGNGSYRMNVNGGRLSFWPASPPGQFHEMQASTVPAPVRDAFLRSPAHGSAATEWGVTIPAATRRQLDRFLAEATGGTLIIGADGQLRLEP